MKTVRNILEWFMSGAIEISKSCDNVELVEKDIYLLLDEALKEIDAITKGGLEK